MSDTDRIMMIEPRSIVTARGERLMVRRAGPDDVLLLADLLYHLSDQTRYLRYLHPLPLSLARAWGEARRMARKPPQGGLSLIATVQAGHFTGAVAVAELGRDPARPHSGEFAVLIRDDYQGGGLGRALSRQLILIAQSIGITQLHADLLSENRASQRMLSGLGGSYKTSFADGVIHAVLALGE